MIVGDICIYINSRKETENTQSIDCVFYQSVMSRFIKKATTIKNVGFLK